MEVTKEELLNSIPEKYNELKEFIGQQGCRYHEIFKNGCLIDECDFHGRQYLIKIDFNSGTVTFIDDLVNLDKLSNICSKEIDTKKWIKREERLNKEIEKTGFSLNYTGNGGNDDYLWYQLSINLDKFTLDGLRKATMLWTDYNNKTREFSKRQC